MRGALGLEAKGKGPAYREGPKGGATTSRDRGEVSPKESTAFPRGAVSGTLKAQSQEGVLGLLKLQEQCLPGWWHHFWEGSISLKRPEPWRALETGSWKPPVENVPFKLPNSRAVSRAIRKADLIRAPIPLGDACIRNGTLVMGLNW